ESQDHALLGPRFQGKRPISDYWPLSSFIYLFRRLYGLSASCFFEWRSATTSRPQQQSRSNSLA
ncbi:MAG: hypothetical protein KIG56_05375, partial [Bacteroidales bacterium]|nr:hypothetical protein [Bacteroidales bacterium]